MGSASFDVAKQREGFMTVARVVIETLPGRAPTVARHIGGSGGLCRLWSDGRRQLAGEWTLGPGHTTQGLSEALCALDPDILSVSVFPELVS